jgi:ABC-type arginine/histidine transport system permease subunit
MKFYLASTVLGFLVSTIACVYSLWVASKTLSETSVVTGCIFGIAAIIFMVITVILIGEEDPP